MHFDDELEARNGDEAEARMRSKLRTGIKMWNQSLLPAGEFTLQDLTVDKLTETDGSEA